MEEPLVGGNRTKCLFINGPILLFWHTEWIWDKYCSTNCYYNTWTTLKVMPEIVYGSLPKMWKVANKITVTWRANLCHLSPNSCYN